MKGVIVMNERKRSLPLPPECALRYSTIKEFSARLDGIVPADLTGALEILKSLGTKTPGLVEEDAFTSIYSFLVLKCREGVIDFDALAGWFYPVAGFFQKFYILCHIVRCYQGENFFALNYYKEMSELARELKGPESDAMCRCYFENGRALSRNYSFIPDEFEKARNIVNSKEIFDEALYIDILYEEARVAINRGNRKFAKKIVEAAYGLSIGAFGANSLMTARIEGQKAILKYHTHACRDYYENLIYLIEAAAKIMKYDNVDQDPFPLIEQYLYMFHHCIFYGNKEDALYLYNLAEKIIIDRLGPYSETIINFYDAVRVDFEDTKNYSESFELQEKIINCRLQLYAEINNYVICGFHDAMIISIGYDEPARGVKYHEKMAALMNVSPVDAVPEDYNKITVGKAYQEAGEFNTAEELYLRALKSADQRYVIEAYENLSKIETAVGNYAKALEYYQKHMQFYDANETYKKYKTYDKFLDLSIMYEQAGDVDKAVENIDEAFADLSGRVPDSWDDSYMKSDCSEEKGIADYLKRRIDFLERIIESGIFSENSKAAPLFRAYFILGVLYFKSGCYSNSMINLMKASKMGGAGCAKNRNEKDIVQFFMMKCMLCKCHVPEVFDESVKIFGERLEISGCDKITLNFAVLAGVAAYKNRDIDRAAELFEIAGEIFNTLGISEDNKYEYKWIESKIAMLKKPKEVAA